MTKNVILVSVGYIMVTNNYMILNKFCNDHIESKLRLLMNNKINCIA